MPFPLTVAELVKGAARVSLAVSLSAYFVKHCADVCEAEQEEGGRALSLLICRDVSFGVESGVHA